MLHYCLAHTAYHLSRWLPKHNRIKLPKSSRYCKQPLLLNLTCFIVFTFFTIGFTCLLTLQDPVPQGVKAAFHVFGVGSFSVGLSTTVLTATATDCAKTTPELYHLSLLLSVISVTSTAFFAIMGTFWLANILFPAVALDRRSQTGFCYESVSCCSCLWHI
ncbi:uncharacterized protein LOC135360537 isoform X2 [Latimeria chalumnae]|uniref:uncharacterized protein LOC135360537 isoform X2 n=1 Tax=Latimeria chalumnae TaxID=7897 RepID=UPI00313CD47B